MKRLMMSAAAAAAVMSLAAETGATGSVYCFDFRDTTLMQGMADKADLKCNRGVLMDEVASHNRNTLNSVTFTWPASDKGPEMALGFGAPTVGSTQGPNKNKLKWFNRGGNNFVMMTSNGISHELTLTLADTAYVITAVDMIVDDGIQTYYRYNPRLSVAGEDWTWDADSLKLTTESKSVRKVTMTLSRSETTKPSDAGYDESMAFSAIRVHYAPSNSGTGDSGVEDILSTTDGEGTSYTYYNMQGMRVSEPRHGIFLRRSAYGKVVKVLVP